MTVDSTETFSSKIIVPRLFALTYIYGTLNVGDHAGGSSQFSGSGVSFWTRIHTDMLSDTRFSETSHRGPSEMSGAEVSLVIGLISGVISIISATKSTYDAVKDKEGLPEAFRDVARRLPIVQETLDAAQAHIQGNQSNKTSEGVKAIIKACESKAEKLRELFQKVAPQEEDSRADRYLKAVRNMGKGGRVEVLMKGILEDVQLLAGNGVMNLASEAQIRALKTAIEEISTLKPSIADEEFPDSSNVFNQYGGGHMFNAIGGKNLYNLGDGNQFQGENLYFGEIFKQKQGKGSIQ